MKQNRESIASARFHNIQCAQHVKLT